MAQFRDGLAQCDDGMAEDMMVCVAQFRDGLAQCDDGIAPCVTAWLSLGI